MKLIVLDTNVIVSAGIKPPGTKSGGSAARLVMDWVLDGQVQVVASRWIVGEYREAARCAKFSRYGFPPLWLEFLIEQSLRFPDPDIRPRPTQRLPFPDPRDAPFLALARVARAVLVTGNLSHFPGPVRHGVAVLSPAEYLARLGEGSGGFQGA